jgi:hypothetical protein
MVPKPINEYTAEEVGMWLIAQRLGDHVSKFVDAGVDGNLLLSLDADDLKNGLGLTSLQAKKVLSNVQFSLDMVVGGGVGGGRGCDNGDIDTVRKLRDEIKSKDEQIAELNRRLLNSRWKNASPPQQRQPEPVVAYAQVVPQQQQYPQQQQQYPQQQPYFKTTSKSNTTRSVATGAVAGAAGGAARGAIGGAIMGAILPGMSAGEGAAAGAAVGALGGGVRGGTHGMMMGPPRRRMMYG